ncbi:MAG: hypothetical protein ACRD0Z_07770 [Acidimicrobiales bacterium]
MAKEQAVERATDPESRLRRSSLVMLALLTARRDLKLSAALSTAGIFLAVVAGALFVKSSGANLWSFVMSCGFVLAMAANVAVVARTPAAPRR